MHYNYYNIDYMWCFCSIPGRLPYGFMIIGSEALFKISYIGPYIYSIYTSSSILVFRGRARTLTYIYAVYQYTIQVCTLSADYETSCVYNVRIFTVFLIGRGAEREPNKLYVWCTDYSSGDTLGTGLQKKASAGPKSCVVGRASSRAAKWCTICIYYAKC